MQTVCRNDLRGLQRRYEAGPVSESMSLIGFFAGHNPNGQPARIDALCEMIGHPPPET